MDKLKGFVHKRTTRMFNLLGLRVPQPKPKPSVTDVQKNSRKHPESNSSAIRNHHNVDVGCASIQHHLDKNNRVEEWISSQCESECPSIATSVSTDVPDWFLLMASPAKSACPSRFQDDNQMEERSFGEEITEACNEGHPVIQPGKPDSDVVRDRECATQKEAAAAGAAAPVKEDLKGIHLTPNDLPESKNQSCSPASKAKRKLFPTPTKEKRSEISPKSRDSILKNFKKKSKTRGLKTQATSTPEQNSRVDIGETVPSLNVTMEAGSNEFLPDFFIEDEDDPTGNASIQQSPGNFNSFESLNNGEVINHPSHSDMLTPDATSGKKRKVTPKDSVRKPGVHTSNWAVNLAKEAWQAGKAHLTPKGLEKNARKIGPGCNQNCNRCVRPRLSPLQREHIFQQFWKLKTMQEKRDFLSRCVECRTPKKQYTLPGDARQTIRTYSFKINEKSKKVCKTMLLNTLGIPDSWIETLIKKLDRGGNISPDKRGNHKNRPNRTTDAVKNSIRSHINLIPRVYSHYTRERTKRQYLQTGLSTERLYKEYVKWAEKEEIKTVGSFRQYRTIFNKEFNLSFFKPRKDQCLECRKWTTATPEERRAMVSQRAKHLNNKKAVNDLKRADKKNAMSDPLLCVSCFDLQKVLTCPHSETSIFFYMQKLSLYNFTLFDLNLGQGYCYLWTELDGHKGANEIASYVFSYLQLKAEHGFKKFIFYSDAPTGQNRNRFIFSMYLHASRKFKISITHRFVESGHSYSEADSIHARIEEEAKSKHLYTPDDWVQIIKTAKQKPPAYEIFKVQNQDIMDFHDLVEKQNWNKDTDGKKIYWSLVREVSTDCLTPDVVSFRYGFVGMPLKTLKVTAKRGHPVNLETYKPPRAYGGSFPLNAKKMKSFKQMCSSKAIPTQSKKVFLDAIATAENETLDPEDAEEIEAQDTEVNVDDDYSDVESVVDADSL